MGRFSDAPDDPSAVRGSAPQRAVNLKLSFPGANPQPVIEPFDRLDTRVSYFIGNDPAKWRADVPVWGGVRYRDLYPGLDLELTGAGGHWQWRLIRNAQSAIQNPQSAIGNPDVTLRVEGADAVTADDDGLHLNTAAGDLSLPLLAAERSNVGRANVGTCNPGALDVSTPFAPPPSAGRKRPAVDEDSAYPLLYATFLGGSNSDEGYGSAVDGAGQVYVTGITGSADFPASLGPGYDTSLNGGGDAFVVKLDAAGTALRYATFLGGSSSDEGAGIAVDTAGSAYVTGYTSSSDFPTTSGAFDTSYNGGSYDVFAAKLNPAGSALAYATFLGGSSYDVHGGASPWIPQAAPT